MADEADEPAWHEWHEKAQKKLQDETKNRLQKRIDVLQSIIHEQLKQKGYGELSFWIPSKKRMEICANIAGIIRQSRIPKPHTHFVNCAVQSVLAPSQPSLQHADRIRPTTAVLNLVRLPQIPLPKFSGIDWNMNGLPPQTSEANSSTMLSLSRSQSLAPVQRSEQQTLPIMPLLDVQLPPLPPLPQCFPPVPMQYVNAAHTSLQVPSFAPLQRFDSCSTCQICQQQQQQQQQNAPFVPRPVIPIRSDWTGGQINNAFHQNPLPPPPPPFFYPNERRRYEERCNGTQPHPFVL